ncbi:DUF882 domain-containing protein [Roseomonas sp. AR75]|uniref:YcbK family protein n=1 Tax=Roseomonas sp. AR75 TaxID=2562311 RepID=UPI0010C13419|nr:DUF882 domain-containing protein [Roseomonas sp. AR75]
MRRALILGGAAAFATLIIPRTSHAAARQITLKHAGSGATFSGTWHDGRAPDRSAMQDLSQVLADPGCPPRAFDVDAIEILWEVATRTRLTGVLDVHSGYRTPAVNRAVQGAGDSQHLKASAVDLGVPTGRLPAVADAALKLRKGGVGVYRNRGFIHLDSGPVRNWSEGSGGPSIFRNTRFMRLTGTFRINER